MRALLLLLLGASVCAAEPTLKLVLEDGFDGAELDAMHRTDLRTR